MCTSSVGANDRQQLVSVRAGRGAIDEIEVNSIEYLRIARPERPKGHCRTKAACIDPDIPLRAGWGVLTPRRSRIKCTVTVEISGRGQQVYRSCQR